MLPGDAQALVTTALLPSKNASNTVEATGGWVAVPQTEGFLVLSQAVGAITGNLTGALLTSANSNGAGNSSVTFANGNNSFEEATDNNCALIPIDARQNKGYMKYVGTVVTGPVLVDVRLLGRPKTTT